MNNRENLFSKGCGRKTYVTNGQYGLLHRKYSYMSVGLPTRVIMDVLKRRLRMDASKGLKKAEWVAGLLK